MNNLPIGLSFNGSAELSALLDSGLESEYFPTGMRLQSQKSQAQCASPLSGEVRVGKNETLTESSEL